MQLWSTQRHSCRGDPRRIVGSRGAAAAAAAAKPRNFCCRAFSSAAARDEAFEEFLANNPPPQRREAYPGWGPGPEGAEVPRAPEQGASLTAGRVLKSFHWQRAQQVISTVLMSHTVTWDPCLEGYLCLPKLEGSNDIIRGDRDSGTALPASPPPEGASEGAATDAAPVPEADAMGKLPQQGAPGRQRPPRPLLLRLPRVLSTPEGALAPLLHLAAVARGGTEPATLLVALLSADSAALAVCRGGVVTRHKVLTGYTTRKKQGKAQLTHMRSCPGTAPLMTSPAPPLCSVHRRLPRVG